MVIDMMINIIINGKLDLARGHTIIIVMMLSTAIDMDNSLER